MSQTFDVLFINNDGGALAKRVTVPKGTTVRSLLANIGMARFGDYFIRINRQPAELTRLLEPEDCISLTPRRIRGAIQSPKLPKFVRFLLQSGYIQEKGTGTDHANWRSPSGMPLKVNPDKRQKSEVDLATLKACARQLGLSLFQLRREVG